MYESPISLKIEEFVDNVQRATQNQILYKVREIVDVDREELIRALKYDRDQYYKGFKDGKRAAWISVKDRLPEIDQIVLTYCNDRGAEYKVLRRAFSDLYKAAGLGDGWYWESIDYMSEYPDEFGNGEVTHWMPLPEPPEKMKGEEK